MDDVEAELAALRERVSELETQAEPNDQPPWQPSRRSVLSGLLAAGGVTAALPYMSQPAAAQAVGQLGDSGNRVDVFGETVDSNQFDLSGSSIAQAVVASGSATLSSGSTTIDTGVATSTTATFAVALGPGTDDADLGADVRADSSSGNYEVDIREVETSVGNPSVAYDVVRVR